MEMNLVKKKKKKGFTLIELIVVIAILGILAAIAVPRLTGLTTTAQSSADKATARTILSAASITETEVGAAFTAADVMKHLDLTITMATAAPTTGTGWVLVRPATGAMTVYKDATLITP